MKKLMIMAAAAVAVVSCSKRTFDNEQAPVMPDANAPVVFGAQTNVEIESKAAIETGYELGIFAFAQAKVPASSMDAGSAHWNNAKNLHYTWQTDAFKEDATSTLFWPAKGQSTQLSFTSYFPYSSSAVSDYTLTQDLSNQSTAPDYAFAWAKAEDVSRPDPIESQELSFEYKVAKLTLSIIADGTTVGTGNSGVKMQVGGSGVGVKSISVYSGSTGLYKSYELDLLTGETTGSNGNLTQGDAMSLQGTDQEGSAGKPSEDPYVEAVGYLAPSDDSGLKATGATGGIVVAIVYNDGVSDQTYTAEINQVTLSGNANANFSSGIVAGNNYKYTLKLGKTGITFTGTVTDWNDVDGGSLDLQ